MKKLFCLLFALLLPLTALGEGWEVSVLPPFTPWEPQTITVRRSDAMFGGLLLVNPWHTRPAQRRDVRRTAAGQPVAHPSGGLR